MAVATYNLWVGSLCEYLQEKHGDDEEGIRAWKKMLRDPTNTWKGKTMAAWFMRYVKLYNGSDGGPIFWPGGLPGASPEAKWTCPHLSGAQKSRVHRKIYGIEAGDPEEE